MDQEFKLPDIGEGTAEGEIIKWLVAVGDEVTEDQPLVEVMTDKATVEIPSPHAGRIESLEAAEGEVVAVGAVILRFGDGAAPAAAVERAEEPGETPVETSSRESAAVGSKEDPVQAARAKARAALEEVEKPARPWDAPEPTAGRVASTPATRRLARELGVDLLQVEGTGRGGRVMKEDVEQAHAAGTAVVTGVVEAETEPEARPEPQPRAEPERSAAPTAPEPQPAPSRPATPPVPVSVASPAMASEREERIPFRGLRRKIAERMREAKQVVPHFTYVEECDMTEVVALRQQAKELGAPHGVKVTFLPFIVRALIEAAKRHPIVNSSLDDEAGEIVLKHYYNVGIATATERGLIVPVVRDADRLDIFGLAREIERLANDARDGQSKLEDLQGGTITITSTGNIGGVLATPIINRPEVAILGVTAIRKRPVVRDDEIVIRDMVNLSLSLDHRIVDGADGALFMRDMVGFLEDPKLLLLGTP